MLDRNGLSFDDQRLRGQANWSPLALQIRSARNDAGHPLNIDPVTADSVHASLLVFPELARLAKDLTSLLESLK